MMRHGIILNIILLALILGCAYSSDEETPYHSCSVVCPESQICKLNYCYDTCSTNKPCPSKNMACTNNLCYPKEAVCAPDTRRCSEDKRWVVMCRNGASYEPEKECPDDQTCDMGACVSNTCVNETKRCRNNNVEICKNQSFTIFSECESHQECNETSFTCELPSLCKDGSKRCNANGNVDICNAGRWQSFTTCLKGQACDSQILDCADITACQQGTFKCIEDTVYTCKLGKWEMKAKCSGKLMCNDGACISKTCQDGQTRCFEATNGVSHVQTCVGNDYTGNYQCAQNQVCMMVDNNAKCVENKCTAGPLSCQNNILFKCEDNMYVEQKKCAANTTCSATSADCIPNCGNGILDPGEMCDGSVVKEGVSCASQLTNMDGEVKCTKECELDLSGCTEKCQNGDSTCDGNTYRYCDNGTWKSTVCTGDKLCGQNGCYTSIAAENWDYIQGFESIKENDIKKTYDAAINLTDANGNWDLLARTNATEETTDYRIDGQVSIVLKGDKKNYIKVTNIPKPIKTLAFSWRSWGTSSDHGTLSVLIDDNEATTIQYTKTNKEIDDLTIDLNKQVKSITLKQGTSDGRIIIDNVRWKY